MNGRSRVLGSVSLAVVALAALLAPSASVAQVQRIVDTIPSPSSRGPYVLSWNGILTISEHVTLGTTVLKRGRDYTLDYASGLLGLNMPPRGERELYVAYDVDPATSKRNQAQPSAAVLRLLDSGSSLVRAAFYFQPAGASAGVAPISTVAVGADTQRGGLKLSSLMLLGTEAGAMGRRSGLKLGAGYQRGGLSLIADYAHAGEDLPTVDGLGLKRGQGLLSLQGGYRVAPNLGFTAGYRSAEDEKGVRVAVQTYAAEYTPVAAAKLQASHQVASTEGGDTVATSQLSLTSTPAQGLALQAGHTRTSSEQKGDEAVTQARVDAVRGPVKLQTEVTHRATDQGASTGTKTQVEAAPAQAVKLTAGLETLNAEKGGQTGVQAGVEAAPLKALSVSAGVTQKRLDDGSGAPPLQETGAQVRAAAGLGALQVKGGYATRWVGESLETTTDADLVLKPLEPLSVTAGVKQTDAGGTQALAHQAEIALKPSAALSLAAGYQQQRNGVEATQVRSYRGELAPFGWARVSGLYRHRLRTAGDAPDTLEAKLSLSPVKQLEIVGAYAQNPEEKGAIYEAVRRSLGLRTQVGFLALSGSYGVEDRLGFGSSSITELSLGVRFSRASELSAAYRLSELRGQNASDDSRYALRYTHNLGSSFNLAVEGETSGKRIPSQDYRPDYKGTAKLQMRF